MKTRTGGFTLIELMVVVIIIAALAAMVLPKLLPATTSAKNKIAKGDIANITTALNLYRLHNDSYPDNLDILLNPPKTDDWKEPYLDNAPIDPWKHKYLYKCPGDQNKSGFDLWSDGASKETIDDDINNWTAVEAK